MTLFEYAEHRERKAMKPGGFHPGAGLTGDRSPSWRFS
jgi:hypothetical protein